MFELTPFRRRRDMMSNLWGGDMFKDFNEFFYGLASNIRADIKETEKEYIIEAELPGVKKEQINVELKEHTLTITALQDDEIKEEGANYVRRERRQGTTSRSFYVDNVDTAKVKAEHKDGILKIVLPKLQETPPDNYKINID
ncbi:MAG: Hsp20/alpha crystallin family protein [Syntrophomonas sp.]